MIAQTYRVSFCLEGHALEELNDLFPGGIPVHEHSGLALPGGEVMVVVAIDVLGLADRSELQQLYRASDRVLRQKAKQGSFLIPATWVQELEVENA